MVQKLKLVLSTQKLWLIFKTIIFAVGLYGLSVFGHWWLPFFYLTAVVLYLYSKFQTKAYLVSCLILLWLAGFFVSYFNNEIGSLITIVIAAILFYWLVGNKELIIVNKEIYDFFIKWLNCWFIPSTFAT